ncbi:fimbria/pilus periplasmic chaperone [Geomonas sp. Red32]|uniref:fimbrial biogenesis chaperone n=1 Tax=Geomonas sp. Red32 TaxID=2912856 RepID=UPI00202CAC88|nr:fimbria/pilus periplasmic chaperone [Geomonas sp. Red32]MCM0081677.1 fimbria/pilus periplasmic chaperone [Geomonas sp. Red32]
MHHFFPRVRRLSNWLLTAPLLVVLSLPAFLPDTPACAGEWRVTPIRVFFERGARSGIVNVENDGDTPLVLQVKAVEWTQDATGADRYVDSNDLIFFPKQLTVPPKDQRLIRLGLKGGAVLRERTFRLYVEEVPKLQSPEDKKAAMGATVSVNIRFAIPIFITPAKEVNAAGISKAELKGGTVTVAVANNGNQHFRVNSLEVTGKNASGATTFSRKADGWYVLNGATRSFSVAVPEEGCRASETIVVTGDADRAGVPLKSELKVDRNNCRP